MTVKAISVEIGTCNDSKFLREHAKTTYNNAVSMQDEHEGAGTLDDDRMKAVESMFGESIAAKERADRLDGLAEMRNSVDSQVPDAATMGGDGGALNPVTSSTFVAQQHVNRGNKIRVANGLPGQFTEWDPKDCGELATEAHVKAFSGALARQAASGQKMQCDGYGASSFKTPVQFVAGLKMLCRDRLWIRQLASTFSVRTSCKLGFRMETKRPKSAAWGNACECIENCDTPGFGLKTLEPHLHSACVTLCREDLRDSSAAGFDLEGYLREAISRDVAELEEGAFFNGNGQGKPLGVFYQPQYENDFCGLDSTNDQENCIPGRISVDDLIKALFCGMPECCRNSNSLSWMFPTDVLCQIMCLKDGNGRLLKFPSIDQGAQMVLFGKPVRDSAYFPWSGWDNPGYWGLLADWSGYYIADGMDALLERDDEPGCDKASWYYRGKTGGIPYRKECFLRLKTNQVG